MEIRFKKWSFYVSFHRYFEISFNKWETEDATYRDWHLGFVFVGIDNYIY